MYQPSLDLNGGSFYKRNHYAPKNVPVKPAYRYLLKHLIYMIWIETIMLNWNNVFPFQLKQNFNSSYED